MKTQMALQIITIVAILLVTNACAPVGPAPSETGAVDETNTATTDTETGEDVITETVDSGAVETVAAADEISEDPQREAERNAFAQESLDAYLAYLENTNAPLENYGLTDTTGIVGQSLPLAYIPLEFLKRLDLPASEVIKDTNIHWYPVFVNSQAETKIEIVDEDGEFAPGEFGGQHTAQAVVEALSALQELVDNPQDYTIKLVEVPALRATFLIGFENREPIWAIPAMVSPGRFAIEENESFLQAGTLYPFENVLRAIQNTAVNVDPEVIR